jgi:hypothetical protein
MSRTEPGAPARPGRAVGWAVLGVLLGAPLGTAAGIATGLAWIELAGTSGFEGYSGYVVAYWALAGLLAGAILGGWAMARRARRSPLRAPTA